MVAGQITSAAVMLLASAFTFNSVNAGELDVPGAGTFIPRAAPLVKDFKRAASKTYNVAQDYSGSNFFDGWSFFNWADPTNGMVNYQGSGDAWSKGLVSIDDNGRAIMKVDDSTWLREGSYRDSIRVTSNTPFKKGQLLVLDAQHMPYGCGTWPAFWTVGANWPWGGEIDIVEGVNNQDRNQMTLHTGPGCEIQKSTNFAGNILQESCDAFYNYNTGCGIQDPSTKTYGKGFNNGGGGAFATLWTDDGISIWFFARNNIPADLSSKKPNPSNWGRPRAHFASDDCSMGQFFGDQTIVFDTTLCGDWGGATYQSGGCPGTCSQRVANPNNFKQAYWAINYVRVFQ